MADETVHAEGEPAPPPGETVHLPGPTYLPVVTAFGLTIVGLGLLTGATFVADPASLL